MIKLNILNMKNFLESVNACKDDVLMLFPDGRKVNLNKQENVQSKLWEQYRENQNCLGLWLEIPNPTDYMRIVSYYAGDC